MFVKPWKVEPNVYQNASGELSSLMQSLKNREIVATFPFSFQTSRLLQQLPKKL